MDLHYIDECREDAPVKQGDLATEAWWCISIVTYYMTSANMTYIHIYIYTHVNKNINIYIYIFLNTVSSSRSDSEVSAADRKKNRHLEGKVYPVFSCINSVNSTWCIEVDLMVVILIRPYIFCASYSNWWTFGESSQLQLSSWAQISLTVRSIPSALLKHWFAVDLAFLIGIPS